LDSVKFVNLFDTVSSKYPSRPTGAVSVEWIGPAATDPATPANVLDGVSVAQNNDTWTKT
jgi:hypothetical protein